MLGIEFDKQSAREKLKEYPEFEAKAEEIGSWLALTDYEEYNAFMDGKGVSSLAKALALNSTRSSQDPHFRRLEKSFVLGLGQIRSAHLPDYDRDAPRRAQGAAIEAINKDMRHAAADFANLIVATYEHRICKHDLKLAI